MRPNTLARTLVSVTAVVGLAAGSLAGAGASFAASASTPKPAASSEPVSPLRVQGVNLGLTTREAMNIQCWLRDHWGYTDRIDGDLGPETQAAFKRMAYGIGGC